MKFLQISGILLGYMMAYGLSERNGSCPTELLRFWSQKDSNESLLIPNNNAPKTGAIYKIDVVGPGINLFEPRIGYRIVLSTTEEVSLIHRFLISIKSLDSNDPPGRLKSLSDKSEPISYNCWHYLIKKSGLTPKEDSDFTMVPFEWESPGRGCVEISALVMDSGGSLFGPDSDPHRALKKTLCIRMPSSPRTKAPYKARGRSYCCRRGRHSTSCVLSGDSETFYKAHSKFGYSFESCSFAYTKCCFKAAKGDHQGNL